MAANQFERYPQGHNSGIYILELRPTQKKGTHAWYCKPSQQPWPTTLGHTPRGEPTASTFLIISKYFLNAYPYAHRKMFSLLIHEASF